MQCKKCGQCCLNTEMMLSEEDIKRLESLGYPREEFTVEKRGFIFLRNINGHCFFLDTKTTKCKVYDYRPTGCKFYPIIYSIREKRCVVDEDCPMSHTVTEEDIKKHCKEVEKFVRKLIKEAELRRRILRP
ncbi:MAG: YkgJ family cysteine cluster protein [Candidatus Baldrarchaeota archaeon]